jgi:hypothetical protein
MTIPDYVNRIVADVRCIKPGWYAMGDVGNPSSGPFPSHKECISRITQPTDGSIPSNLRPPPK